ncbi:hypothetical protein IAT38_007096 [Cryptococcus sp. DSM 104549]
MPRLSIFKRFSEIRASNRSSGDTSRHSTSSSSSASSTGTSAGRPTAQTPLPGRYTTLGRLRTPSGAHPIGFILTSVTPGPTPTKPTVAFSARLTSTTAPITDADRVREMGLGYVLPKILGEAVRAKRAACPKISTKEMQKFTQGTIRDAMSEIMGMEEYSQWVHVEYGDVGELQKAALTLGEVKDIGDWWRSVLRHRSLVEGRKAMGRWECAKGWQERQMEVMKRGMMRTQGWKMS